MKVYIFFSLLTLFSQLLCSEGIEVSTHHHPYSPKDIQKLLSTLTADPKHLLSEIGFQVEHILEEKIDKLPLSFFIDRLPDWLCKRSNTLKAQCERKTKLQRLLKGPQEAGNPARFLYEGYTRAHILAKVLSCNPRLIQKVLGKPFEFDPPTTEAELAQAFDILALYNDKDLPFFAQLSYSDYKLLKDYFSDNTFLTFIHTVRECIGCPLSRLDKPAARKYFEDEVVTYTQQTFTDKKQKITLTDFGCGELFQTTVLLSKILNQGYHHIRINLIDTEYAKTLHVYRHLKKKFSISSSIALDDCTAEFIHEWVMECLKKQTSRIELIKDIREMVFSIAYHHIFTSFCQWFKALGKEVEVVLYEHVDDYVKDCQSFTNLKSNIIISCDASSILLQPNFDLLHKQILMNSGMIFNIIQSEGDIYFAKGSQEVYGRERFQFNQVCNTFELPSALSISNVALTLLDSFLLLS